jgi:uncharacterized protein (TIGR03437 family)
MNLFRVLFTAVVCLAFSAAAATPDRIIRPIDTARLHTIPSSVHHLARQPQLDRGPAAPDLPIDHILVFLKPSAAQQADLDRLLADQQNPASPQYHQWLTPEAYAERFGLSTGDYATVSGWLTSQGLTVHEPSRGRNWIAFSGTAAQVSRSLHTSIHSFEVEGRARFANTTDPAVPEALAGIVAGFGGLNNFASLYPKARPKTILASGAVTGQNYLTPSAFATIYNISPLYSAGFDGTGQSIVIVGESDILLSDLRGFRTAFGLAALDPKQVLYGADPGFNGAQVEANLDLEWSGAIAPKATIYYVYGQSAFVAFSYAVSLNFAPVISISYGGCESDNPVDAYRTVAQQANAQGITTLSASGDSGGGGCDLQGVQPVATLGRSVAFPADLPEVTAVGGTMFQEGAGKYWNTGKTPAAITALSYIPEAVWNESSLADGLGASGGGASRLFSKPGWQTGPGVPADSARDVPDVALSAAFHDAYLITYNSGSTLIPVAGTSAASPSMAGIVALLNHYQVKQGFQKTAGLGNINPQLYRLAQSAPSAFHDVVSGTNAVPCEQGTQDCVNGSVGYSAGPGYDLATGLGSVDANVLVTSWHSATSAPVVTVTANPTKVTWNDKVTLTATVTGKPGVPTGSISFEAYSIPLGSAPLTLINGVPTATLTFEAWMLKATATTTVYASYSGDAAFSDASASARVQVTLPTAPNTAVVVPATSSSPVYGIQSGTEGPTWQVNITLSEIAGVPALLTGFTIDGQAQSLAQYFPSPDIPLRGSLAATFVFRNLPAPVTKVFGFTGTDAGGNQWSRQLPVRFVPVYTVIVGFNLWAEPLTILQNPAAPASCQWSQQLIVDGAGYGQRIVGLYLGSVNLSASIPAIFGTNRLAPWGSLQGTVCWSSPAVPSTDALIFETEDDFGNIYSQTVNVAFSGPPTRTVALSASPSSLTLKPPAIPGFQAQVTLAVNLSDATQPWSAAVYPADETTAWLQLSQYSGTGPATITVSAQAAGFAPGVYRAVIVIKSPQTTPQNISIPVMWVNSSSAQGPVVTGVGNSFSFTGVASPGMLMSITGTQLANSAQAYSVALDNSLAGVSVTVNGWPAPILYVSPYQINIQVPYETGAGQAALGINNNGAIGGYFFPVAPSAPGVVYQNGITAKAGGYATVYLTGLGDVSPAVQTGIPIPSGTSASLLPKPLLPVSVTVGGAPAIVQFAGLIPGMVGIGQINFQVPLGAAPGLQSFVITVNGVSTVAQSITVTAP